MRRTGPIWFTGLPLLLLAGSCAAPHGFGPWSPDHDFTKILRQEECGGNGIEVGEPKIYDDSSLRAMLDQARGRLASINAFNESALTGRLGAINGATIAQSQFGLQVSGPSLAGVSTVANGATSQTTTNALPANDVTQATSSTVNTAPSQNATTTVAPVAPSAAPTVPAGLSFTPPTGISGSALDVLNEELQLNSDITGLQLLLEGALSDRFIQNTNFIKPRATIGFGISLVPPRRYRNAVAVVEVEVVRGDNVVADESPAVTVLLPREKTYNVAAITDQTTSIGGGAVIGTVGVGGSFFSGHKTYFVVQDQDTVAIERPLADPQMHDKARFAWEFRPVLGRDFVQGGMKQTFVQLAFPKEANAPPDCLGSILVRTYWRRFDQKTGLAGEVIPGSVLKRAPFSIPQFDLTPLIGAVDGQDLGDGTLRVHVGGHFLSGTTVQLGPATYDVSTGLRQDDSGLSFVAPAEALARWTAQVVARDGKRSGVLIPGHGNPKPKLNQLACVSIPAKAPTAGPSPMKVENVDLTSGGSQVKVHLEKADDSTREPDRVGLIDRRTAAEIDLVGASLTMSAERATLTAAVDRPSSCESQAIQINKVQVKPFDDSNSELLLEFKRDSQDFDKTLLDIGHKVFGLADTGAVVSRELNPREPCVSPSDPPLPCMKVVVPTALLVASRSVRAFVLFKTAPDGPEADLHGNDCFNRVVTLDDFALESAVEHVVLQSVDKKGNPRYLLYGNGLQGARILPDKTASLVPLDGVPPDHVVQLRIDKAVLARTKKLLLQKEPGTLPVLLDLPAPDPKSQPKPPQIGIDSPVVQNTDQMVVAVENATSLVAVTMGGQTVHFERKDASSILLTTLRADGVTTEQKTRELKFAFKGGATVTVKLEVVAARVGVRSP